MNIVVKKVKPVAKDQPQGKWMGVVRFGQKEVKFSIYPARTVEPRCRQHIVWITDRSSNPITSFAGVTRQDVDIAEGKILEQLKKKETTLFGTAPKPATVYS